MAEEFGKHQRSGSSIVPIDEPFFSNIAGAALPKLTKVSKYVFRQFWLYRSGRFVRLLPLRVLPR